MTTTTLSGFKLSYDGSDNPIFQGSTSADFIYDENLKVSYSLIQDGRSGMFGQPEVEFNFTDGYLSVSEGAFDGETFAIKLVFADGSYASLLSIYSIYENQDYVFILDSSPDFVEPTDQASLDDLLSRIQSVEQLTGQFAPNTEFNISDIPAGVSQENDFFEGTDGNDLINAGGGNDTIYGLAGDDTLDGGTGDDHLYGGLGKDRLNGGDGNDYLNSGGNLVYSEGDLILGSQGNDIIDYRDLQPGYGWNAIRYADLEGGVDVFIDATQDLGRVVKASGDTDTILGVQNILDFEKGGFNVHGTSSNDTFAIVDQEASFLLIGGNDGVDDYDLTINSIVRLSFMTYMRDGPSGGIDVDLSLGNIYNDGYGNVEQIKFSTVGSGKLEIDATHHDDTVIGSSASERFILYGGNNTLHAGEGFDAVRYDRNQVTDGINADLRTGIITSQWYGFASTDTVTGVEEVRGSSFSDIIYGDQNSNVLIAGAGDDYINPGDNPGGGEGYDYINSGTGADTVDLSVVETGYVDLDYSSQDTGVSVEIDGIANKATIDKGANGNDIILQISNPLNAGFAGGGLGIRGTSSADVFNIMTAAEQWMQVEGGAGTDSYVINGTGDVRLNFRSGVTGIDVNLATGNISNDGFGNTESITGSNSVWEVYGTNFNDSIFGSAADESFILAGGNDTLDGGDGFDRIRFDRPEIDGGVTVDLEAGIASGSWNGTGFSHNITGIEYVRGGAGDDTLIGNDGSNRFFGGDGNDYISTGDSAGGFDGYDDILGSNGSDTFDLSGVSNGYVHLWYGDMSESISISIDGISNFGQINKGSAGVDTVTSLNNALGSALGGFGITGTSFADTFDLLLAQNQWMQVRGGAGTDSYVINGTGNVRLDFRSGVTGIDVNLATGNISNDGFGNTESITGSNSVWEVYGTNFNDSIVGSAADESFILAGGNDTLDGGDGFDRIRFDRPEIDGGVTVDLEAGIASGSRNGTNFSHNITGIEYVRGSAGDDTLAGNDGSNRFFGGDGNDTLTGGSGSDTFVFRGAFGHDVITDFDETEDSLEFYAADGSAISISDLIETADTNGNRVLSTSDGLSSVTFASSIVPPGIEPAFDIVLASSSGNVATFEIYATEVADAGDPGLEDLQFVLSHNTADMTIDGASISAATGITAVPNLNQAAGTLTLAGFALPPFTDLSTPVLTFEATILNEETPLTIAIDDIVADNADHPRIEEQFDFSSVEISTMVTDRFGNALSDAVVSAYEVQLGDELFLREVGTSDTSSVFEIVARPTEAVSSIDFDLLDNVGLINFQVGSALSGWSVQSNTNTPDTVSFAGFGAVDGSQDLVAGQETVLATFTTSIDPDFVIDGIFLNTTAQADISVGEIPATSKTGNVTVHQVSRGSDVYLDADKPIDAASEDAITANDALQALRLAVGLNKSDGTAEWHDYIAADINMDGQVTANDALNILKFAVGLTDGPSADWVFVDGDADWSGIGRRDTNYEEGVWLENVLTDTSVNMTGILVGDVNGSF